MWRKVVKRTPTKDELREQLAAASERTQSIKYTIKCKCGHTGRMVVRPGDMQRSFTCSKCGKTRKG